MCLSPANTLVPEDQSKLRVLHGKQDARGLASIVESLTADLVVLVREVDAATADDLVARVAQTFELKGALEKQAAFAEIQGHRRRSGKYYMTVNARRDYQFITPHSEGTSFINMQLASFFCHENTTDGGETILMNVNQCSEGWLALRETVAKGKTTSSKPLSHGDIARAKIYGLNLPSDLLKDEEVVSETAVELPIPGLQLVEALAQPKKTYAKILDRDVFVYWDSVDASDLDSAAQYAGLLRDCGLLKEPPGGLELRKLDNAWPGRIRHSGVSYAQLFTHKITHKLTRGDFIILNNPTWTHSVSNWAPRSGIRKVTAAFS
jgi:hypothetical protein